MKKLSNTKAIVGAFVGGVPATDSYSSKSVRKISNGYITRECSNGVEHESFSATPQPSGVEHGPNETRNSLADAMEFLKGRKI